MAVVTTHGIQEYLHKQKFVADYATAMAILPAPGFPPRAAALMSDVFASSVVDNSPIVENSSVITVDMQPCFYEDYYFRFHLIPTSFELGNVFSDQTRTFKIWNAYPSQKILSMLTSTGAEGMTLVEPVSVPSVIPALKVLDYSVLIPLDGPATIDASYTWTFGTETVSLSLVGSRVVSLNVPFSSPAKESLAWLTDILESKDGTEQRIRCRKKPRQGLVADYPVNYDDMQFHKNRVYSWAGRVWAVPLWTEAQAVGSVSNGASSIVVPSAQVDLRDNTLAFLYENSRKTEPIDIGTIVGTTVNLEKVVSQSYSNAWLMPVRVGRVVGRPRFTSNGNKGVMRMEYEFTDNIDFGLGSTPTQFLGSDIYFDELYKGSDEMDEEFLTRVDVVDYEWGSVKTDAPWANTKIKKPVQYIVQGLTDIMNFRKFLHRRAGRLRPYWMPSFNSDLRVVKFGSVTTGLPVYADDYNLFAANRTHIAVKLLNGTWLSRTITGITDNLDGTLTLTLDSTLGGILAADIQYVSYLGLYRFDSDVIELDWQSNRTVVTTIPVVELTP